MSEKETQRQGRRTRKKTREYKMEKKNCKGFGSKKIKERSIQYESGKKLKEKGE